MGILFYAATPFGFASVAIAFRHTPSGGLHQSFAVEDGATEPVLWLSFPPVLGAVVEVVALPVTADVDGAEPSAGADLGSSVVVEGGLRLVAADGRPSFILRL